MINVTLLVHANTQIGNTTQGMIHDLLSGIEHGLSKKYKKYQKCFLPALQNTNCGWRVGTKDKEYFSKYWDGIIFVDVDHIVEDPDDYLNKINDELSKYHFYIGGQLSYSKNGFHLVFFIPKREGTVEEYYRYASYIYTIIFKKLIPKENYDWHNFQHHQVLKLTTHKWVRNKNFKIEHINIDDNNIDVFFRDQAKHFIELYHQDLSLIKRDKLDSSRYTYTEIKKKNNEEPFFYFEHTDRYLLFMTLMYIYNEDVEKVYDTACEIMKYSYTDRHSYGELCNYFHPTKTKMDWYKKYKPDERYNLSKIDFLKEYFGIECIDNKNLKLELNENEYLLDYKDKIINNIKNGFNFLKVNTGGGKTTFWDSLRFNSITIEPYNSVVNDKFDNTYKAVGTGNIIDSSESYQITNYWRFIDFVNTENKFYDYIIVDESHIIGTQSFRNKTENGHTMIDFINALKNYNEQYPESKIILQTATPSNEEYLFNIDNNIIVNKKDDRFVQIIYDMSENFKKKDNDINIYEYNIKHNIVSKVQSLVNEGRKVYIYYGSGGIKFMKSIQSLERLLKGYKVAIYHKKNENNNDINEIREKKMIGDYDILISSCYFSVGCDLNDRQNAGIIIIGNNTYQEDEQVIGRFRNSKNIKVYILLDQICNIKKTDVSELLIRERKKIRLQNEIHNIRSNTLINSVCADDNVNMYSFIECSDEYFKDYERKFEFYKNKGYHIVNTVKKYFNNEDNEWYYDICENIDGKEIPIINYIDDDYDTLHSLDNIYYKNENDYRDEIWNNIKENKITDYKKLIKELTDRPILQDWIKVIEIFAKYYDLTYMIHNISERSMKSITYSKCKELFKYIMKLKNDNYDKVEYMLINDLIDKYDNVKGVKEELEIWLVLYYCLWISSSESEINHRYDMDQKKMFSLFNTWKKIVISILEVNSNIRNYIIDKNKDDIDFVFASIPDFLKDEYCESIEDKINYYINNYVYKDDIKRFINFKLKLYKGQKLETNNELKDNYLKLVHTLLNKNVQITDKFKHPEKYNLKLGQCFDSCKELAEYTQKTNKTISTWINKGWILKY